MKAVIGTTYGSPDTLRLEEVEKPIPGDGEVLVRVLAASVNAGDWHLLRGDPFLVRLVFGLRERKIRVLGADVAGQVEAVGRGATQFQPGDAVFGDISGCGFGAFAEYVCAPESALALKPGILSFEEAAAVPAASVTALQGLRDKGRIQAGQKVLINGASGGVGMFAVQIAKSFGAEVTAVCSTRNLDRVRALGADHAVDYTVEDFTRSGQRYDLILAANGYHPIWDYQRALQPRGRYVMTGGSMAQFYQAMFLGPWISLFGSRKMGNLLVKPNQKDLAFMSGLIEAGKVAPVIDRRYPLSEVPDAIRYLEEGHAQGKVVITLD
jgi:NADPH:quinone reductase-like Zn-dependent oxidoreductase